MQRSTRSLPLGRHSKKGPPAQSTQTKAQRSTAEQKRAGEIVAACARRWPPACSPRIVLVTSHADRHPPRSAAHGGVRPGDCTHTRAHTAKKRDRRRASGNYEHLGLPPHAVDALFEAAVAVARDWAAGPTTGKAPPAVWTACSLREQRRHVRSPPPAYGGAALRTAPETYEESGTPSSGHRRAPQTAGRAGREISSTTPPTTTQTRAHARKASAGEPRTCATRDRCDVRGRCAVAAWLERGLRRRETPKQSGALHCSFELEVDKGLDSWRDYGIEVT